MGFVVFCLLFFLFFFKFRIQHVSIKIRNLLICFCRFELSCPILAKDNFIEHFYILLSY